MCYTLFLKKQFDTTASQIIKICLVLVGWWWWEFLHEIFVLVIRYLLLFSQHIIHINTITHVARNHEEGIILPIIQLGTEIPTTSKADRNLIEK